MIRYSWNSIRVLIVIFKMVQFIYSIHLANPVIERDHKNMDCTKLCNSKYQIIQISHTPCNSYHSVYNVAYTINLFRMLLYYYVFIVNAFRFFLCQRGIYVGCNEMQSVQ